MRIGWMVSWQMNGRGGVEELNDVPDLKGTFDQRFRGVPLHHADMVRRGKDDGIALGLVEEGGFPGEDFARVPRFLDVVDPARSAAVLGARGEFPPEPGGIEDGGGDAGRALPMNQMAGEIDIDPRIPPPEVRVP